ncbi:MAG TPA: trypsin-like peptidase domain-containing protein [Acidimicrobiales bacterium]|nr:trypsin-like peptidase domain-containing protein [Acidimicrobiales bacterium]
MAVDAPPRPTGTAEGGDSGQGRRWWPWLLAGVAVLFVGGVAGDLFVGGVRASDAVCNATNVADETLPTVVTISVTQGTGGSVGSGEVIRSDGYILTNNHVISDAANGGADIEVTFSDGGTAKASLTGRDPKTDLAVIKASTGKSLPVIPFGSSSDVVVGEPVVALGAPLGLSNTVTSGIVSALDRSVEVPSDNGGTALLASALQTDAAINPGNSGGALTDCSGDLIGVNSAGAQVPSLTSDGGSIGLNFAIPVDLAKQVSDQIIATGSVTHGFFGLQVVQIPPAAAEQAGTPQGLYVAGVVPGGPAAQAGIRQGDIITEVNGETATDATQLEELTLTKQPGDKVELAYVRDGETQRTTVTLGTEP